MDELANVGIEIELGGKKLKIVRLSIKEIFAPAKNAIKQEHINNSKLFAEILEGKEKQDFLDTQFTKIPTGKNLDEKAQEFMQSSEGMAGLLLTALNKCQKVTEAEVTEYVLDAVNDESKARELIRLIKYIQGGEADIDEVSEVSDSKKKLIEQVTPKIPVV
jgi:hypothetical protein